MASVNVPSLSQTGAAPVATATGATSSLINPNGVALSGSANCSVSSVADISAAFKIYTTPTIGYDDYPLQNSGIAASSANFTGLAKAASGTFTITTAGKKILHEDYAALTSKNVFGNSESVDLFNNLATLENGYDSVIDTMLTSLNGVTSSPDSALEVHNNLLALKPERYSLSYNSSITRGASTIIDSANKPSRFRDMTAVGPSSSQSVTVDVTFAVTGNTGGTTQVTSIVVKTQPSVNFATNDSVVFSCPITGASFKILSISSTQAGELNAGSDSLLTLSSSGVLLDYSNTTLTDQLQHTGTTANNEIPPLTFTKCTLTATAGTVTDAIATVVLEHETGNIAKILSINITSFGSSFADTSILSILNFDVDTNGSAIAYSTVANPIQVATVNGSLDDVNGTAAPLEAGDTINVNFTVGSSPSQKDANGNDIKYSHVCTIAFPLV